MNISNSQSIGIVSPIKNKNLSELGKIAIMTATYPDLYAVCENVKANRAERKKFDISSAYIGTDKFKNIAVLGPFVGAPYAVMLLEQLALYKIEKIIFIGWCGSITEKVKIGDIIIADSAYIDEGTSQNYGNTGEISHPDQKMTEELENFIQKENEYRFHKKSVWTTDAIYRESIEKVKYYQEKGAAAVEMEASALFSAGKFKNIAVSAILAVSDDLSTYQWKSGFAEKEFTAARKKICEIASEFAHNLVNNSTQ